MTAASFILNLLHFIVSFVEFVDYVWRKSCRCLMKLVGLKKSPPKVIDHLSSRLNRIPAHLAFVVVEDQLSLVDIARLVVWSAALKIKYVTVYDYKGQCKKFSDKLSRLVEEECIKYLKESTEGKSLYTIQVLPHSTSPPSTEDNETSVRVVGPDDGRQRIVDVTARLAATSTDLRINDKEVDVNRMDQLIREASGGWIEPTVIIRCGKICSLLGFLPWETRLSEIMSVSSHVDVDVEEYGAALHAYCFTEQRLGK